MENLGYSDGNLVLRGDLIDKMKAYEVDVDKTKLSAAMKLFKKYNLVDYDVKDESEDALITLYPSLQFGWDIAQFQQNTGRMLLMGLGKNQRRVAERKRRTGNGRAEAGSPD